MLCEKYAWKKQLEFRTRHQKWHNCVVRMFPVCATRSRFFQTVLKFSRKARVWAETPGESQCITQCVTCWHGISRITNVIRHLHQCKTAWQKSGFLTNVCWTSIACYLYAVTGPVALKNQYRNKNSVDVSKFRYEKISITFAKEFNTSKQSIHPPPITDFWTERSTSRDPEPLINSCNLRNHVHDFPKFRLHTLMQI